MKEAILYCGKDDINRFVDFNKSKSGVCIKGHTTTTKVKVRISTKYGSNTHWAWWNNEKEELICIKPSELEVYLCLPFSAQYAERQGLGKIVPVLVEKL